MAVNLISICMRSHQMLKAALSLASKYRFEWNFMPPFVAWYIGPNPDRSTVDISYRSHPVSICRYMQTITAQRNGQATTCSNKRKMIAPQRRWSLVSVLDPVAKFVPAKGRVTHMLVKNAFSSKSLGQFTDG